MLKSVGNHVATNGKCQANKVRLVLLAVRTVFVDVVLPPVFCCAKLSGLLLVNVCRFSLLLLKHLDSFHQILLILANFAQL